MFPTVGHLLSYLFGIEVNFPIPTYGTMIATAFILAIIVLKAELKRKEKEGLLFPQKKKETIGKPASMNELISSGIFGFIVGWKLLGIFVKYSDFAASPQAYIFSLKGSVVLGILAAATWTFYTWRSAEKKKLDEPKEIEKNVYPHEQSSNILIIAAISGIIGAKLFHQLENWDQFIADPIGNLFSAGGFTFFGGLIVGSIVVIWYSYRYKINIIHLIDSAAPAILLAYAIGRTGCQLSGDGCWGVVNLAYATPDYQGEGFYMMKPEFLSFLPDWMFAFNFPHNVIHEGVGLHHCSDNYCSVLEQPVFPTSFYEFAINLTFFVILFSFRKMIKASGLAFSIMLFMNSFERFFIEKIRVNNKFHLLGMEVTQAEIISTCIMLLSIGLAIFFIYKYRKKDVLSKD